MEQELINKFNYLSIIYYKINNEEDLKIIYDLWIKNVVIDDINKLSDCCLNYYGLYYKNIVIDYDLIKKYFEMASEKGNNKALYNLGSYYQYTEKNYDLMKNYYEMAIDKGNREAFHSLIRYYKSINEFELMKKFCLIRIEKGDINALNELSYYYSCIEINQELEDKYTIMLYEINPNIVQLNYRQMKKILDKYNSLKEDNIRLNERVLKLEAKIDKLETELKCVPEYGEYFFDARDHFYSNI